MKESEVTASTKRILDYELSKKYSKSEYEIGGETIFNNADVEWRPDIVVYKESNGDGVFGKQPIIAVECKGESGCPRRGLGQSLSYGWLGYTPVLAVERIVNETLREFIREQPVYLIEIDNKSGKGEITSNPDEYRELDIDFRRCKRNDGRVIEILPRQINDSLAPVIRNNYKEMGYKSPGELINDAVRRRLESKGWE